MSRHDLSSSSGKSSTFSCKWDNPHMFTANSDKFLSILIHFYDFHFLTVVVAQLWVGFLCGNIGDVIVLVSWFITILLWFRDGVVKMWKLHKWTVCRFHTLPKIMKSNQTRELRKEGTKGSEILFIHARSYWRRKCSQWRIFWRRL